MPQVLIPSDNRDFVFQLAAAYRRRSWDVVVGASNFDLQSARYDLVHLQWPEELSGWKPPSESRLKDIVLRLDGWAQQARVIITVHNLLPHRQWNDPAYHTLFEAVYQRVSVLAHFTETSRQIVATEFPVANTRSNVVTGGFNLDYLLPAQHDPEAARQQLGLSSDDFVVLVFGGLREWAEVTLVRDAFATTNVARKRLLMCGRYDEFGPVWRQRWRRWTWARWLRKNRAITIPEYIPDAEVHRVLDASDVLLLPRLRALNSGLPALAASFGKPLAAPRYGAFPELLNGTANPLYETGNARDLARAIEEASRLERPTIYNQNRDLAESWDWDAIVASGLQAVGLG